MINIECSHNLLLRHIYLYKYFYNLINLSNCNYLFIFYINKLNNKLINKTIDQFQIKSLNSK